MKGLICRLQVGCLGADMGMVTVLKDQTLKQLNDEAGKRWPGSWDAEAQRVRVLILCKRSERVILEQHGATVMHEQPVFGLFHRPRHSLHLFESQGFSHRDASFQFLDIATAELGQWLQHLVSNDGWKRSSTRIAPLPIDANVPMQRKFEIYTILTFRHPDLPELKTLHLPMPLESIVGKAYISFPAGTQADEEDPIPKVEVVSKANVEVPVVPRPSSEPVIEEVEGTAEKSLDDLVAEETEEQNEDEEQVDALFDGFSAELLASVTHSANQDAVPKAPVPEVTEQAVDFANVIHENAPASEIISEVVEEVIPAPEPAIVAEPPPTPTVEPSLEEAPEPSAKAAPIPVNEEPRSAPVPSDGGVVDAFRKVVKELLAEGMEASDMMGDPRFAEASEFCEAAGVDTWPLFMQLTSTN